MLETFLLYDSHKCLHAVLPIRAPWLLGVRIINMALSKSAYTTSAPQTANSEGQLCVSSPPHTCLQERIPTSKKLL